MKVDVCDWFKEGELKYDWCRDGALKISIVAEIETENSNNISQKMTPKKDRQSYLGHEE